MMKNWPDSPGAPRVLIMMAVYNGALYLEEQIESIRSQTYRNWELAIQDDGSSDESISIIKYFCTQDRRIRFYRNNTGFHGPYRNFHLLANRFKGSENYDYYMFCDQDDIWYPDKITQLLSAIDSYNDVPALVYADFSLCDSSGKILEDSIDRIFGIAGRTVYNAFLAHRVFGCNLLMNAALFRLVPEIDISRNYLDILSHDNVYTKFAAVFGRIIYQPVSTMLYRRHENNVTATSSYRRTAGYLIKRAAAVGEVARAHTEIYNHSLVTIAMMHRFPLTEKQRTILAEVEIALRKGGLTALRFIRQHNVTWGRKSETFSRKIVLVSGIYKRYLLAEKDIKS